MTASDSYDFVVIGAGAAGCVLANRLSASQGRSSVLLLEAGGKDVSPWIHIPLGYGKHFTNPAVNWLYSSEPQAGAGNRRILQPRGKVLGGSTSINGLLYIRGQHEDYDRWRDLGNAGWGYADVLPYFRKSENQQRGADEYHGAEGPLWVSDVSEPHPLCDAYLAAAVECGYRHNPDFNGATQEGFGYNQWTLRKGLRSSAATAFLRPARRRANLRVITRAHATRILFRGTRATGVEYLRDGIRASATARAEVLVAGGSFNSPQLLQLSGVGPASLSQRFGIGVVADLPGVGMNLQDHYTGRIVYECSEPLRSTMSWEVFRRAWSPRCASPFCARGSSPWARRMRRDSFVPTPRPRLRTSRPAYRPSAPTKRGTSYTDFPALRCRCGCCGPRAAAASRSIAPIRWRRLRSRPTTSRPKRIARSCWRG